MWMLECVKTVALALVIGAGVMVLLMGVLGAISAAILSARITQEQEQRDQDGER